MTIFRHKENKKLYTVNILHYDINYTSRNTRLGIYATPFNWKGEELKLLTNNNNKQKTWLDNFFVEESYI